MRKHIENVNDHKSQTFSKFQREIRSVNRELGLFSNEDLFDLQTRQTFSQHDDFSQTNSAFEFEVRFFDRQIQGPPLINDNDFINLLKISIQNNPPAVDEIDDYIIDFDDSPVTDNFVVNDHNILEDIEKAINTPHQRAKDQVYQLLNDYQAIKAEIATYFSQSIKLDVLSFLRNYRNDLNY